MVLSVIIGEETEVLGVRACLTWKPLTVPTLMGRMKWGCVKALTLPPALPSLQAQPWPCYAQGQGCAAPPQLPHPKSPSRPLHPGAAVSHQVPPPTSKISSTTTSTTTPNHPSPSPPTMQSGPALLHLTSLAGAEQRPTRHWDNESVCVYLYESE